MGIQWRARTRGCRTARQKSPAPAGRGRPAARTVPAWALTGAVILAFAAVLAAVAVLAGSGPTAAAGQRASGAADPAGTISTVAGGVGGPAVAIKVNLGVSTPLAGTANSPCGVWFGAGQLFIADNWTVRSVSPLTGGLTTPAGTAAGGPFSDGSPAPSTPLDTCAVAADSAGNLVIADVANDRIRVVAAAGGTYYGQPMTAGNVYTVAGTGGDGSSGDGGPATSAQLSSPQSVAVDGAGNLVVASTLANRIRVVAAADGTYYGQQMTAGDIYTVAGTGAAGYSGDGGPAGSAQLSVPAGLAVDAAGNLVLADTGNSRIRVVAAADGTYYGMQMTAGSIYLVAGNGTAGYSGDGNLGALAELNGPQAVTLDGAGNLVLADTGNYRVRVVAETTGTFYGRRLTAGHIYTIAGSSTNGFFGDRGPATATLLALPCAAAVDAAGNLVIADTGNNRVRVVAESTGTFYGQPMTAGDIYTIAGSGITGFSGDGGPATAAKVRRAQGVTTDAAGNLVIADTGNNRVRVVAESTGAFYGQEIGRAHV